MADGGNIDVLMRVVSKGRAMQAESSTEFATGADMLRDGFATGQFCDLREFSFAAGAESSLSSVEDDDDDDDEDGPSLKDKQKRSLKARKKRRSEAGKPQVIDMQPVSYTRLFDSASTLLWRALVECETLDQISIAKRKAAGTTNSGEIYLRLDFSEVLLTDLDWKDAEHIIEETGTFIYRKIEMRYRPQKPDGSLGVVARMVWTMKAPNQAAK